MLKFIPKIFKPKILLVLFYFLFYVVYICILNPLKPEIQTGFFLFSILIYIFRFDFKKLLNDIKLFAVFILVMSLIYLVFCLTGFNPESENYQQYSNFFFEVNTVYTYWLNQALCRIQLFLSSVLTFNILISFIDLDKVISLPININYLKVIILAKSLFENATGSLENFIMYLEFMPEFSPYLNQIKPIGRVKRIRQLLQKNLLVILSLIFYIMRESEKQGELIDNRIKHCFPEKPKEER